MLLPLRNEQQKVCRLLQTDAILLRVWVSVVCVVWVIVLVRVMGEGCDVTKETCCVPSYHSFYLN